MIKILIPLMFHLMMNILLLLRMISWKVWQTDSGETIGVLKVINVDYGI